MVDALSLFRGATLGAVGVLLLVLGGLVASRSLDREMRRPLGLFLALVSANYLFDAASTLDAGLIESAKWRTIGLFPVLLDPPALLAFAFVVARRPLRGGQLALVAAPSAILAVLFIAMPPATSRFGEWDLWWAYAGLLGGYYLAAYALVLREHGREARPLRRDRLAVLAVGLGVVVLPRVVILANEVRVRFQPGTFWDPVTIAWHLPALFALYLIASSYARSSAAPLNRPSVDATLRTTGALLAVVAASWVMLILGSPNAGALLYAGRWLVFSVVLLVGMERFDLLEVPTRERRAVRVVILSVVGIVLGTLAASFAARAGLSLVNAMGVGAATVGAGGLIMVSTSRLMPGHADRDEQRAADAYRAHLELGRTEGELEALRERLGIPEATARRIRELAAAEMAARADAPILEEGRRVMGRYDVLRFLGAGTFGRAFLARDADLGEQVVLKELSPEWRRDPPALARFRREVEAALAVRHPNLVGFRALVRWGTGHLIVLEYVEGETLRQRIHRAPLDPAAGARLASDLLAALGALHDAGLVHRDVKPENVVLRPDGRAVLLDLGSATASGASTERAGPGTPRYMAPEQARGEDVDARADLHALGVILQEAVVPLPAPWVPIVGRATAPEPADRFEDARAMARAFAPAP